MQCPNCNLNIKDDASFCIHCGARFEGNTPSAPQLNQNTVVQNSNVAQNQNNPVQNQNNNQVAYSMPQANNTDCDKYIRAYLGGRYDKVMNSNFSWGTFFFGWIWLFTHKLWGAGFKLIFTMIGLGFILGIVNSIVGMLFAKSFVILILILLAELVGYIYVIVMFCKDYSNYYLEKANFEVNEVLNVYKNEEEALRVCEKRGKPLYIILIIFLLISFASPTLAGYVASQSMSDARKGVFLDTTKLYVDSVKNGWMAGDIVCKKNAQDTTFTITSDEITEGKYFVPVATSSNLWNKKMNGLNITGSPETNATNLLYQGGKSPWNNSDVYGVVLIDTNTNNTTASIYSSKKYYVALVDEAGHGIGSDKLSTDSNVLTNKDVVNNASIDASSLSGYLECQSK